MEQQKKPCLKNSSFLRLEVTIQPRINTDKYKGQKIDEKGGNGEREKSVSCAVKSCGIIFRGKEVSRKERKDAKENKEKITFASFA